MESVHPGLSIRARILVTIVGTIISEYLARYTLSTCNSTNGPCIFKCSSTVL